MKKRNLLFVMLLLLPACATTGSPTTYQPSTELYATAQSAAARETAVIRATQEAQEAATRQASEAATAAAQTAATAEAQTAATSTAVYRATADYYNFRATSIAQAATADALSRIAIAEEQQLADHNAWLALQRQRETAILERAYLWNTLWPWLAGAAAIALVLLSYGVARVLIGRSRPVVINRGENREPHVLVYSQGGYRVLPGSRSTQPLLLPPPETAVSQPQPLALPALTQGHVLIAGETDSGKSTAMRAVLQGRGENVVILDPHDDQASWGSAQVIGGGRDFEAIGRYLDWMREELITRYQQRSHGRQQFTPLTVATDEMPAIVAALGRSIGDTWRIWLREGRKVGLFFAVSTQSTRVTTLGIKGEGDLLENFAAVILLGQVAANEYPDLVGGMERPAVLRTLQGAQPIIVPNVTTLSQRPLLTAPPAASPATPAPDPYQQPENVGLSTAHGFVFPTQIRQILAMTERGESGRAIEEFVFGYTGGQAYKLRTAVLEALLPEMDLPNWE